MEIAAKTNEYFPTAHLTQELAPTIDDHLPTAQFVHTSIDKAPKIEDNLPATQFTHVLIDVAPDAEDHPCQYFYPLH